MLDVVTLENEVEPTDRTPFLAVGDPAPPLEIDQWLNGPPPGEASDGVRVVSFWRSDVPPDWLQSDLYQLYQQHPDAGELGTGQVSEKVHCLQPVCACPHLSGPHLYAIPAKDVDSRKISRQDEFDEQDQGNRESLDQKPRLWILFILSILSTNIWQRFTLQPALAGCIPIQAWGCQPASAQSSPLTAELETRKQIASAISLGRINRFSCV